MLPQTLKYYYSESEVDTLPAEWQSAGLDWNLGIPRWFSREVRKAAGLQLERDAAEEKLYLQAVRDEMKGFYDDDEDGSSDDGCNDDTDGSSDDGF